MNTFIRDFMKTSAVFALVNTAFIVQAHSQTENFEEINESVKKYRESDKGPSKFSRFLDEVYDETGIRETFTTEFPNREKLKGIDLEFKPLLKCLRKMGKKGTGGLEGPRLMQDLLERVIVNGELIQDSHIISSVVSDCKETIRLVDSVKVKRDIIRRELEEEKFSSIKMQNFIADLFLDEGEFCEGKTVALHGGVLFIPRVGFGATRCLMRNGSVIQFIKASGGLQLSFIGGAAVSVSRTTKLNPKVGRAIHLEAASIESGTFIAINYVDEIFGVDSYDRASVGPMLLGGAADLELSMGVRIINGKTHWSYLLNKLR